MHTHTHYIHTGWTLHTRTHAYIHTPRLDFPAWFRAFWRSRIALMQGAEYIHTHRLVFPAWFRASWLSRIASMQACWSLGLTSLRSSRQNLSGCENLLLFWKCYEYKQAYMGMLCFVMSIAQSEMLLAHIHAFICMYVCIHVYECMCVFMLHAHIDALMYIRYIHTYK
jgi:hypothetical protein